MNPPEDVHKNAQSAQIHPAHIAQVSTTWSTVEDSQALVEKFKKLWQINFDSLESKDLVRPGHRVPFHWPPHPVSYAFHILKSDWTGKAKLTLKDREFEVKLAKSSYGVFARIDELWLEAKADTESGAIRGLIAAAEPYLGRMREIRKVLHLSEPFWGSVRELEPYQLLMLLYAPNRDIANEARIEIEKHAANRLYTDALIMILEDQDHPFRRSAQWCVLDLFEDLPSYVRNRAQEDTAVRAMRELIWSAEDDYARTIFKAGTVIGGHLSETYGGPVLVELLDSPSKFGRRSALHGLFHVVEWVEDLRHPITSTLKSHLLKETDPLLKEFNQALIADLEAGNYDHVPEPLFPEERL